MDIVYQLRNIHRKLLLISLFLNSFCFDALNLYDQYVSPVSINTSSYGLLSTLDLYNFVRGLRPRSYGEKLSRVEGSPALPSQLLTTVYMSKVVPVDRVKVNPTKFIIDPA